MISHKAIDDVARCAELNLSDDEEAVKKKKQK